MSISLTVLQCLTCGTTLCVYCAPVPQAPRCHSGHTNQTPESLICFMSISLTVLQCLTSGTMLCVYCAPVPQAPRCHSGLTNQTPKSLVPCSSDPANLTLKATELIPQSLFQQES